MTTIDPSSRLLAQLRALALDWKQRVGDRRDATVRGEPAVGTPAEEPRAWMEQVARAVVASEPNDPDRRRKAFRIFLQAVVARECGIRQVDDARFQGLVDRVQETMEADPKLRAAIDTAGDLLLRSATP
jgi:hypothetical protein